MCDAASKSDASLRVFSDDVCVGGTNTDNFSLKTPQEAYLRCYYNEEIVKTLYPNLAEQWGAMEVSGVPTGGATVDKACLVWRLAPPWDSYVIVKNYVNPYTGVVPRQDVSNDQELLGDDYDRVRAVCVQEFKNDPRYRYGTLFSGNIDNGESKCVVTDGLTGYQWTVDNSTGTSINKPLDYFLAIRTSTTVGPWTPLFSCESPYIIGGTTAFYMAYDLTSGIEVWTTQNVCDNR